MSVETGQKHIDVDTNRKGDLGEYYAVTWLWDQGYEVFKNAGCTGPIDLIAYNLKTQETLLIDVKSFTRDPRDGRYSKTPKERSRLQKEQNIVQLGFNPVTRKLRFIHHRETE